MSGGIYLVTTKALGEDIRPVKIGRAVDVASRVRTLQTGCPYPLVLESVLPMSPAHAGVLEPAIHRHLAPHRLRGEWFHFCDEVQGLWDQLVIERVLQRRPFEYPDSSYPDDYLARLCLLHTSACRA